MMCSVHISTSSQNSPNTHRIKHVLILFTYSSILIFEISMKRRGVCASFLPAHSQDVGRTDMDQISQLYVATDIPRHQPFVSAK